jgi:hypothetical protein
MPGRFTGTAAAIIAVVGRAVMAVPFQERAGVRHEEIGRVVGQVVAGEQQRTVRVACRGGERHGDRAAGAGLHGERGGPFQRPVRGGERDEHRRVVTGEDAAEQRVVHAGERRSDR